MEEINYCNAHYRNVMKKLYLEHDGTVITDEEAEEAWNNLCGVFATLRDWDNELKSKNVAKVDNSEKGCGNCYGNDKVPHCS